MDSGGYDFVVGSCGKFKFITYMYPRILFAELLMNENESSQLASLCVLSPLIPSPVSSLSLLSNGMKLKKSFLPDTLPPSVFCSKSDLHPHFSVKHRMKE